MTPEISELVQELRDYPATDPRRTIYEPHPIGGFYCLVPVETRDKIVATLTSISERIDALLIQARDCYHIEGCPHWVEACTRYQRAEARLARATGELERLFELFGHQATADVLASVSSPVTEKTDG